MLDPATLAQRRAHFALIDPLLTEAYGYPAWRQHLPPVDELVSTILSQATSDGNRDKGFYALKARYPDWQSVRDAPVEEIEQTIRPAGLSRQKAPRIQAALRFVTEHQGTLSLEFLDDLPVAEAKAWLTQMDGIGHKTAAIILCFAFNKPAFPVDTHVHRVTARLGLIGPRTDAEKAHHELEAIVPPSDYYAVHLNLIQHGRTLCKARNPRCAACFLCPHCRYYQEQQEGAVQHE
ncbi:MAG: endonuclease III [Anaerolineae bacterium]|nr:endonuclease III [Anaerolineae bacterium]